MSVKKLDKMIGEMSAMGAGAVHGGASKEKEELNEEGADCIKDYMSMGYSYREALAECQDMDESKENAQTEALLRKYIREKLIAIRRQSINEEHQLRMVIRGMLQEAEDANPHPNTGINKLRDAFKKARPTIRRLYKQLTSSDDQRTSFTSHLLRGFQRMFDEVDALSGIQSASATPTDPNSLSAPPADLAAPPEGDSDIDISIGPDDEQDLDLGVDIPEEEEESLMDLAEVQIVSEQETSNLEKDLERKQGADSEREEFGSGLEGMEDRS